MNEEMGAANLLRAAARLVERSLLKLDMREAPCPHCSARLFANIDQARVYEGLSDTPSRLLAAADRIEESIQRGGGPRRSSRGFAHATIAPTSTRNEQL